MEEGEGQDLEIKENKYNKIKINKNKMLIYVLLTKAFMFAKMSRREAPFWID